MLSKVREPEWIRVGNSQDGKRTSYLKFIKEKGTRGLIKEISEKIKAMNSENIQPQISATLPLHATILELESGHRHLLGFQFWLLFTRLSVLEWSRVLDLHSTSFPDMSARMMKLVRPQAFSIFLPGFLRGLSLPPPDPDCSFMGLRGKASQGHCCCLGQNQIT